MEESWWKKPDQLDERQKAVISLDAKDDYVVVGPPGSGKTNLLILRATYLHRAGTKNIAILTFNRPLREFLAGGAQNYSFAPDKIQTYLKWGTSVLYNAGAKFEATGDFSAIRMALREQLSEVAKAHDPSNRYDAILLDEAQDYTAEEIDIFKGLTSRLFAVGDTKQQIYDGNDGLSRLKQICKVEELTHHYRNGLKICRLADGIRGLIDSPAGLEATANYSEAANPSSVISYGPLVLAEQVETALAEIRTQLVAYPGALVGVLCPRHEELNEVWQVISGTDLAERAQLQRHEDGYMPLNGNQPIIVTTIHGAKGLEFRACHLLGMDKIKRFKLQKNMAFTAVTRAKTSLRIYHQEALPGYLEAGLAALDPPPAPPTLENLFD